MWWSKIIFVLALKERLSYIAWMLGAAVIIPARLHSSRLPNKPLNVLGGEPLIVRVAQQVQKASLVEQIIVATDADEVCSVVERAGFIACKTGDCASGTDRVAEVAQDLDFETIVNVQGDEPFISAEAIEASIRLIQGGKKMASAMVAFSSEEEYLEPSNVKVLVDEKQRALYFSRAPIPYHGSGEEVWKQPYLGHHIGIYAYERRFLLEFSQLPVTLLERTEALEQLRVLYFGHSIHMAKVECDSFGIDTPEDLVRAQVYWETKKNG